MIVELRVESIYTLSIDVDDEDEAIRIAEEYYAAPDDDGDLYPEVEWCECESEEVAAKVIDEGDE